MVNLLLLLFLCYSFQELAQRIICIHLTSHHLTLTPTNFMSSFTPPINLPLGLLPGSFNLIILLIYSQSLLCSCPNHFSLASDFLSKISNTCCPSDVLIPDPIHLCYFQREPQHFNLCYLQLCLYIGGLTTVLYTFPLILADTLLSPITPDTFLQIPV